MKANTGSQPRSGWLDRAGRWSRWRVEGKGLDAFHRRGAAIIAQIHGQEAALEYVRKAPLSIPPTTPVSHKGSNNR